MRKMFACAAIVCAAALVPVPIANAIPGYDSCGVYSGYQIDVKGVNCGDSWLVDAYDWEGAKFQSFGEYNCYTAQYDVKPIVLTCVSPGGELVVSE
jgi:hypothetical protein